MSALFGSESAVDGIPLSHTMPDSAGVSCSAAPQQEVGPQRHSDIGMRELQAHAASCHYLKSLASARYRGSRNPKDDEEAQRWSVLEEEAQTSILALRRAQFNADELTMAGNWTGSLS